MFLPRKKIEIFIEALKTSKIISLIEGLGLLEYSIIHNVEGRDINRLYDAQEVTDVLSNDYVIVICTHEEKQLLLNEVMPVLKKFGGVCYISDIHKLSID